MVLRIHRGRQSTTQSSNNSNNGSTYHFPSGTSKKNQLKSSTSYNSAENLDEEATLSHSHSLCDTREYSRTQIASSMLVEPQNQVLENKSLPINSQANINYSDEEKTPHNDKLASSEKSKGKEGPPSKRNAKLQAKRFRMETKAAKTLALIVGGFVVCWLPFFTVYLIRPFCTGCTPDVVFSTLFWLGYCNSAINPVIYALFSKDFRYAFQQIIIRVCCPSYFNANRSYFSPNKRQGNRPPFPFPHPFMNNDQIRQQNRTNSANNLAHLGNSERFR